MCLTCVRVYEQFNNINFKNFQKYRTKAKNKKKMLIRAVHYYKINVMIIFLN